MEYLQPLKLMVLIGQSSNQWNDGSYGRSYWRSSSVGYETSSLADEAVGWLLVISPMWILLAMGADTPARWMGFCEGKSHLGWFIRGNPIKTDENGWWFLGVALYFRTSPIYWSYTPFSKSRFQACSDDPSIQRCGIIWVENLAFDHNTRILSPTKVSINIDFSHSKLQAYTYFIG